MDFIFVSTKCENSPPNKDPFALKVQPAFGAHIMFLGWVKLGYGQFEV
jgi:hypothetical protein